MATPEMAWEFNTPKLSEINVPADQPALAELQVTPPPVVGAGAVPVPIPGIGMMSPLEAMTPALADVAGAQVAGDEGYSSSSRSTRRG